MSCSVIIDCLAKFNLTQRHKTSHVMSKHHGCGVWELSGEYGYKCIDNFFYKYHVPVHIFPTCFNVLYGCDKEYWTHNMCNITSLKNRLLRTLIWCELFDQFQSNYHTVLFMIEGTTEQEYVQVPHAFNIKSMAHHQFICGIHWPYPWELKGLLSHLYGCKSGFHGDMIQVNYIPMPQHVYIQLLYLECDAHLQWNIVLLLYTLLTDYGTFINWQVSSYKYAGRNCYGRHHAE